jgi:hypothetical protein
LVDHGGGHERLNINQPSLPSQKMQILNLTWKRWIKLSVCAVSNRT